MVLLALLSVTLTACGDSNGTENPDINAENILMKYAWRGEYGRDTNMEVDSYLEFIMVFNSIKKGHLTEISWCDDIISSQYEYDFTYEFDEASGTGLMYDNPLNDNPFDPYKMTLYPERMLLKIATRDPYYAHPYEFTPISEDTVGKQ